MSENNKTTIKVKLSDEDYHDIVIDWEDKTCEYHQQIFQQLAAYTGIPIFYIRNSWVKMGQVAQSFWLVNTNRLWRGLIINQTNETVRSRLNDGDCFTLRFYTRFLDDQDRLFDFAIDLIDSNDSHGNECNSLWCQHMSTRVFMDKMLGIVTKLELQKKIKAQLPVQFCGNSSEYRKLLSEYNIRQYLYGSCIFYQSHRKYRPYLPHRG